MAMVMAPMVLMIDGSMDRLIKLIECISNRARLILETPGNTEYSIYARGCSVNMNLASICNLRALFGA